MNRFLHTPRQLCLQPGCSLRPDSNIHLLVIFFWYCWLIICMKQSGNLFLDVFNCVRLRHQICTCLHRVLHCKPSRSNFTFDILFLDIIHCLLNRENYRNTGFQLHHNYESISPGRWRTSACCCPMSAHVAPSIAFVHWRTPWHSPMSRHIPHCQRRHSRWMHGHLAAPKPNDV